MDSIRVCARFIISLIATMPVFQGCSTQQNDTHLSSSHDRNSNRPGTASDLGNLEISSKSPSVTKDGHRDLKLTITGIAVKNLGQEQICAVSLLASDSLEKGTYHPRSQCQTISDPKNGQATIILENLPVPAYVMAFHDVNGDRILNFGHANLIVLKEKSAIEGFSQVTDESGEIAPGNSHMIFLNIGHNELSTTLRYEPSALSKLVIGKTWESVFGWFASKHRKPQAGSPDDPGQFGLTPESHTGR